MSEELKPCPFCAKGISRWNGIDIPNKDTCAHFFKQGRYTFVKSVRNWKHKLFNTRPIEDKLRAENDLGDKAIESLINDLKKNQAKLEKAEAENKQLQKSYAVAIEAISQSNTEMIKMSGVENDLRAENERLKERVKILDEWERDLNEQSKELGE